jgi:putative acetyltransferase
MINMLTIRQERLEDIPAIWQVNAAAFGHSAEADLVDALRRRGVVTLSLVATEGGQVIGHILFTPITIEAENDMHTATALGPLAVLPLHQNKGIGSRLVRVGLDALREARHGVVIVLGHAAYYPRFGFVPASRHGIRWDRDVPDDVFMVVELLPGALDGVGGVVHYQPEFADL